MNSLIKFFRTIRRDRARLGRRSNRYTDPSTGLEYNKINTSYRVSPKVWDVDLARTAQVIRDLGENVNVHGEIHKINSHRGMVDFAKSRAFGRGR